jgi:hypothetical protein
MNHYQINDDGSGKVIGGHTAKSLAFMSKALGIPVTMTPDSKLEGMQVERDMFERLFTAEHKERCTLELAALEACSWLNSNATGRAYSVLTDALAKLSAMRGNKL